MKTALLTVTCRDPLVVRDGRPFGFGSRMKSLPWIYPSVFIGSLRSLIGKEQSDSFTQKMVDSLKTGVAMRGPFPIFGNRLYFPKPIDCVVGEEPGGNGKEAKKRIARSIRPEELRPGEYSNLPEQLLPAMLSLGETDDDFKPVFAPTFWSQERMTDWLCFREPKNGFFTEQELPQIKTRANDADALDPFEAESRTHAAIDPETGTAQEGQLFRTAGLDLNRGGNAVELFGEVMFDEERFSLTGLSQWQTLGGRKRPAFWRFSAAQNVSPLSPPKKVAEALRGAKQIRMILATPALFQRGTIPGWLDENLTGRPPEAPESVTLRLRSLAADRPLPISGWSYEDFDGKKPGPKPVRRMTASGSVYFFEVIQGDASDLLRSCWLRSVSDDAQDRRDGFGLALWGTSLW